MKPAFTPGPWTVIAHPQDPPYHKYEVRNAAGNHPVCSVFYENETGKANAQAIAALPDLHEALARAVPWLGKMIADGGHLGCVLPNDAVRTLQMAEAALAKVKS